MNIKCLTNFKNASSWQNASFEFDQDVARSRNQTFLTVNPKVGLQEDNQPVLILELYGLRYKHFKNFKIELKNGESKPAQEETYSVGNLIGSETFKEMTFFPTSPEGIITLSDGFATYELKWSLSDEQILVTTDKCQVIAHFEQGIIDLPDYHENQKMLDMYFAYKEITKGHEASNFFDDQIAKLLKQNSMQ